MYCLIQTTSRPMLTKPVANYVTSANLGAAGTENEAAVGAAAAADSSSSSGTGSGRIPARRAPAAMQAFIVAATARVPLNPSDSMSTSSA